jgi:hypothetical protein
MGPCKQMKRMMDHGRWLASIVYLVSIGGERAARRQAKPARGSGGGAAPHAQRPAGRNRDVGRRAARRSRVFPRLRTAPGPPPAPPLAATRAATLAVAFTVKGLLGGILVIILLVIQFMAMIW